MTAMGLWCTTLDRETKTGRPTRSVGETRDKTGGPAPASSVPAPARPATWLCRLCFLTQDNDYLICIIHLVHTILELIIVCLLFRVPCGVCVNMILCVKKTSIKGTSRNANKGKPTR